MGHLSFLSARTNVHSLGDRQKTLVDLRPWQTAEALAPLAVTAEETEFSREAERLADHEVDQAFASALRLAGSQAQHRSPTGPALALAQQVEQLQRFIKEDQALVESPTKPSGSEAGPVSKTSQAAAGNDDLENAKAQLGLDSDQLADAQQQLDRALGDDRAQIQGELSAHEALMSKYDSEAHGSGQVAILSAGRHKTLASRVVAWNSQLDRNRLILQAIQQAQSDAASLTADYKTLEAKANESAATTDSDASRRSVKLADLKERSEERQLLSILNDRIQTEQQLATVYGKWSAQVILQHRTLLHLILQSLALIAFILICIVLCDALVRQLMANPALDHRQMQTLRALLQLGIQALGGLCILLVLFGWPRQMTTILGLTTAGLTIAMQDFIIAFFGWFVLIGKNGIRVGDWVEIDGVGGEVIEIGLMGTTLLETGDSTDRGHPTGRRITFLNSFAIRGKLFNFSTAGQWMWDEVTLSLSASRNTEALVERIRQAVKEETKQNARIAEHEWKRGTRDDGLSRFSAEPVLNLRPSGSGLDIHARFVTRASERFILRNRLYQRIIDLLHKHNAPGPTDPVGRADSTPRPGSSESKS